MQLEIEEIKEAVELLADAGGAEARIVAQLVLDLAISVRFDSETLSDDAVQKLLHLRIARHRAANYPKSNTVH